MVAIPPSVAPFSVMTPLKVLRVSFCQPLHCLILLAQTDIHQGNLGSIASGSSFQIMQYLYRRISFVRYCVGARR